MLPFFNTPENNFNVLADGIRITGAFSYLDKSMKNPLFQFSSNNLESDGNSNRFDKTKSFSEKILLISVKLYTGKLCKFT